MHKLHPGAKWNFRLSGLVALIPLVIGLVYVINFARIAMFAVSRASGDAAASLSIGGSLLILVIALIVALICVEIYARLSYNNWEYEFTDMNLKLERGIIWKKYSNIPYERVQNVDIRRGIIARMLGFSTVDIQTAGASYSPRGGARSEGHIPAVGVKHAEEIREFVMHKISRKHSGM